MPAVRPRVGHPRLCARCKRLHADHEQHGRTSCDVSSRRRTPSPGRPTGSGRATRLPRAAALRLPRAARTRQRVGRTTRPRSGAPGRALRQCLTASTITLGGLTERAVVTNTAALMATPVYDWEAGDDPRRSSIWSPMKPKHCRLGTRLFVACNQVSSGGSSGMARCPPSASARSAAHAGTAVASQSLRSPARWPRLHSLRRRGSATATG
jgi:hypothetical protein